MIRYLRDTFRVLSRPCSAQAVFLSRRMDGQLSPGERLGLRLHLCICSSCRAFNRQLAKLRSLARAESVAAPLPLAMPAAVRQRLNTTLTEKPRGRADSLQGAPPEND